MPKKQYSSPPHSYRTGPRGPRTNLEEEVERSRQKSQRKMAYKQVKKRKKKSRRRRRFLLFILLILLTFGLFKLVQRFILTDRPTSIPGERAMINKAITGDLALADTRGRMLTPAEKKADLEELIRHLEAIPPANCPGKVDGQLKAEESLARQALTLEGTDETFMAILDKLAKSSGGPAHLLNQGDYQRAVENVGKGYLEKNSPYARVLTDPRVKERYARLIPIQVDPAKNQPRLTKSGKSLILSGLSFEEGDVEKASRLLPGYIRQAQSASRFIIDLRGVRGPSHSYWIQALATPLCHGSFSAETTLYFSQGFDSFVSYMSSEEKLEHLDLQDDREDLSFQVPESIRRKVSDMSYQKLLTFSLVGRGQKLSKSRVILLVDKNTGNAAESFADFCQHNQLATIAGEPTMGNAWDIPPAYLQLKHSGFVLEFDITLQQSLDGTDLTKDVRVQPDLPLTGKDLLQVLLDR